MKLDELKKYRTELLLEDVQADIKELNEEISLLENEYFNSILEDGECMAIGTSMVSAGMGNVVASQPSALPGNTNGSTTGSGDVSFPFPSMGKNVYAKTEMGKNHGAHTGKKSREKKLDLKKIKSDFEAKYKSNKSSDNTNKPGKIMSFDDFNKDSVNTIKKIDDI